MKNKKQHIIINRYTIGFIFILLVSFFIEKKIDITNQFKVIRFGICTLIIYSFYLFVLNFIKINYKKKKPFDIKYLLLNNTHIIKYLFPLIVTIINVCIFKNTNYLFMGLCELVLIYLITSIISIKYKKIAYAFNGVGILLYTANHFILMHGSTFLSYIMVSNLESFQMLGNKIGLIILLSILVITISFLPFKIEKPKSNVFYVSYITIVIYALLLNMCTLAYSPMMSYADLSKKIYDNYKIKRAINNYSKQDNLKEFYNEGVSDYIKYNKQVGDNPNIILVFTEGLSKSIIDDPRGIMNNTKDLISKSISFNNYYNHVAATFRGIIGSLYSGYQNNNTDTNSLISLQSILSDNGYTTRYINVEPNNKMFTEYLEKLGFNEFKYHYEDAAMFTDKEAYNELFINATEMNEEGKPFFITMYTVETHVGFDSSDKKYADGGNQELNKFYNNDYQLGEFIKRFNESPLYNNTILILTTDHGTYADIEYNNAFGTYAPRSHSFLDQIPFIIYHKGINARQIDAMGKNSLDLVPTILDYIDKEKHENYFLGDSLFTSTSGKSKFDTYYYTEGTIVTHANNIYSEKKLNSNSFFREKLLKYFAESTRKRK